MTIEFFRILVDWLSIQKFRWMSNSSRLRWPQNSSEILQGFWSDIFLKIEWPRNSYEILQGFWSEFWLSAIVSNNSDDYEILQELDDNRILAKFFWDLIRIFEEIDDHGILMKFSKDFYQKAMKWKSSLYTLQYMMRIDATFRQNMKMAMKWNEIMTEDRYRTARGSRSKKADENCRKIKVTQIKVLLQSSSDIFKITQKLF